MSLNFRSFAEIHDDAGQTIREGQTWGRWRFQRSNLTLNLIDEDGRLAYEVDLEHCNNSAEILDWIAQVAERAFVSQEDIGNLVTALNDLSGRLQSRVCGGGADRKFDFGKHLRTSIEGPEEGEPANG